jgi:hypothetical protein
MGLRRSLGNHGDRITSDVIDSCDVIREKESTNPIGDEQI